MRTVDWDGERVILVDQTLLPLRLEHLRIADVDTLVDAIRRLAVWGTPAIGVAGALGVVLAARAAAGDAGAARAAAARLRAARPTAVNLAWAVDRVLARLPEGLAAVEEEAVRILEEDVATNEALGRRGAEYVRAVCGGGPVGVQTHCNAGGLACMEWGTALGIVRALHETGDVREVFVDETRPLLQGSRLTAFELDAMGVAHRVVVDGAGPSVIARRLVDVVIVGADRVAANGDTANKIGTYPLALAAQRAGIPFVVAAPESTIDLATPDGAHIEIEERASDEIVSWGGIVTAPPHTRTLNLAFDVTPADLVTAVVTERRVVRVSAGERL